MTDPATPGSNYPPSPPPPPPGYFPPPPPPGQMPQGQQPVQPHYRMSRPRTGMWRTLGLMLFIGVIGFNILLFFAMIGGGLMGGGHDPRGVRESVRAGKGPSKVAVIPIEGIIMEGGGGLFGGGVDPVKLVEDGLRRARRDENVAAVVLEINSPGGGVTASDTIYKAIQKFREESGKPVVVYMKDLAASGGYYVAAPADHIVANRTTLTGSIGVIIQLLNFHGTLTEVIKGQDATVKSGDNKAMGSMFADPESEEYQQGRQLLQELSDEMHALFKSVIKEGRGDRLAENWEEYADGRIFSAETARRLGFVDSIGHFEDAVKEAERLAGVSDVRVVEYGREMGLGALLGLKADNVNATAIEERLSARIQEQLRLYPNRPMAIWVP
jgi:protease IV